MQYGKNTHEIVPKKYLNILECSITDQTNIQKYSDNNKIIKKISKYIRITKKQQIQTMFLSNFFLIFDFSKLCAHHWCRLRLFE